MMSDHLFKLDNPVWYALTETHAHLCLPLENLRFYKSDYCTFGAVFDSDQAYSGFETYGRITDSFYVVGHKPVLPDSCYIKQQVICDQMIYTHETVGDLHTEKEIVTLSISHYDHLLILSTLYSQDISGRKLRRWVHFTVYLKVISWWLPQASEYN